MKNSEQTRIELKNKYLFQIPYMNLEVELVDYFNKLLDKFPSRNYWINFPSV